VLGLCGPLSRAADVVIQRTFDVILAFPILILGIAIAVITSPGLVAIVTTVALANVRSSDGWRAPRSSRSESATMSPRPRRSGRPAPHPRAAHPAQQRRRADRAGRPPRWRPPYSSKAG